MRCLSTWHLGTSCQHSRELAGSTWSWVACWLWGRARISLAWIGNKLVPHLLNHRPTRRPWETARAYPRNPGLCISTRPRRDMTKRDWSRNLRSPRNLSPPSRSRWRNWSACNWRCSTVSGCLASSASSSRPRRKMRRRRGLIRSLASQTTGYREVAEGTDLLSILCPRLSSLYSHLPQSMHRCRLCRLGRSRLY